MKRKPYIQASLKDGFTLFEVMIAVMIFGIGIAGTYQLVSSVLRSNQFSTHVTEGTTLAMDKVEELLGQTFDSISAGNDSDTTNNYTRTWTVTAPSSRRKHVNLIVAWQSIDGARHSISNNTIISKP